MGRLWTPWRMEYVQSAHEADGCVFCDTVAAEDDEKTYIVARSKKAFAILNAYPYNPGHLMVAPFRHIGDLESLHELELADISRLLQRAVRALREAAHPKGFNVGMNLGRVAGAGIPDHVHWHVVPRWDGDTNFMPIIGATRVLPELLEDTYTKLKAVI